MNGSAFGPSQNWRRRRLRKPCVGAEPSRHSSVRHLAPVEIDGHVIPEGSKVLLFLAAANRDPRHWSEPDRFDITRSASGHVGFGFGIHQCLGQMVARVEMEAVVKAMLPRVEEIRPTAPAERRLNNTLHAIGSLPIELVPAT